MDKQTYRKNREHYLKYYREYRKRNQEIIKRIEQKRAPKHNKFSRVCYQKNKSKYKIWNDINYLEDKGEISKGKECGICHDNKNLIKHHWRYDKPLLFSTLCKSCHTIIHSDP